MHTLQPTPMHPDAHNDGKLMIILVIIGYGIHSMGALGLWVIIFLACGLCMPQILLVLDKIKNALDKPKSRAHDEPKKDSNEQVT